MEGKMDKELMTRNNQKFDSNIVLNFKYSEELNSDQLHNLLMLEEPYGGHYLAAVETWAIRIDTERAECVEV